MYIVLLIAYIALGGAAYFFLTLDPSWDVFSGVGCIYTVRYVLC